MSQPKRYKFFKHIDYKLMEIDARMVEWSDGNWVDYSDYAALAAENERLRSKLSFSQSISEICNQPHEGETITVKGAISSGKTDLSSLCQCKRLAAENERLRKACELVFGEAAKMKFLRCYPGNDFYVSLEAMEEMKNALGWNAAKEGRDAK